MSNGGICRQRQKVKTQHRVNESPPEKKSHEQTLQQVS